MNNFTRYKLGKRSMHSVRCDFAGVLLSRKNGDYLEVDALHSHSRKI